MYIVSEQNAGISIAQDYRVMHDEEDHTVLAYKVDNGHSRRGKREQDARYAQQRERHNEQNSPERTYPEIEFNLVFSMQIDVCKDETYAKQNAYEECKLLCKYVENMVPNLSHIEEKGSAKDVTQVEPQRIIVLEKPITYCRKEQNEPMKVANSFDEMHQNIGCKEGKQEPKRAVSEGQTAYMPTKLCQSRKGFAGTFWKEAKPTESYHSSNDAPRKVRNEKTTHSVAKIGKRLARNTLVEVAGFKEEETHEEERPSHRFLPPRSLSKLRLANCMKRHHSQNAESAKQIEGIVSRLHSLLLNI